MLMQPGPLHQPLFHLGLFMSTVVISNEMNTQVIGYIPFNLLQQGEKLLVAVPRLNN